MKDYTGIQKDNYLIERRLPDYISPHGKRHSRWECLCKCGNVFTVMGDNVRRTKSCGCLRAMLNKTIVGRNTKHGDASGGARTRLYRIWSGMKSRCYNPNSPEYDRYGGAGIDISDEWRYDYSSFKEWALLNGYTDELSIDRIDGTKGYCPENCRWATAKMQQNNLKSNVHMWIDGTRMTVAQVAELFNVPHYVVLDRKKGGWTDKKIIEYLRGVCGE